MTLCCNKIFADRVPKQHFNVLWRLSAHVFLSLILVLVNFAIFRVHGFFCPELFWYSLTYPSSIFMSKS